MTCEIWRDQIGAYVDGELAASHDEEVSKHLKQCGECTLYAAGEIQLKRAVGVAGRRYQPSADLRANVLRTIGASQSKSLAPWFALAAAAVLLVITLALPALRTSHDISHEIADLHLSTIASANPVDVVSSDMHTVKPWFQGKLPFTFNLPELDGSPFTLIGGRLVYLHGNPMALLLFQYRLHKISVLIGPQAALGSPKNIGDGFHSVSLHNNGYTYVTMSDASPDVVKELSDRIGNANR